MYSIYTATLLVVKVAEGPVLLTSEDTGGETCVLVGVVWIELLVAPPAPVPMALSTRHLVAVG